MTPLRSVTARRLAIARLLADRGPMFPWSIREELGISRGQVTFALKCDWFRAVDGGWAITRAGRVAVGGQGGGAGGSPSAGGGRGAEEWEAYLQGEYRSG